MLKIKNKLRTMPALATKSDIKNSSRITILNSEEAAQSQTRISEFLIDNTNKDNIRPCAPSSPNAEKTSNLSPQAEQVPLLKESVSEAEGTAKMVWSVVNRTLPQLHLWNLRIQVISRQLLASLR